MYYLCNKMGNTVYHLILICVAIAGVWIGYRRGFVRQLSGLLGLGFGVVASRLFSHDLALWLMEKYPGLGVDFCREFTYQVLASAIIYGGVFLACMLTARVLRSAMQIIRVGALDSVLGAALCLFKYMLGISLVLNLIICFNHDSSLLKFHSDNDGNLVQLVLDLAPAVLGTPGADDIEHKTQLRDAKAISSNFYQPVIVFNS